MRKIYCAQYMCVFYSIFMVGMCGFANTANGIGNLKQAGQTEKTNEQQYKAILEYLQTEQHSLTKGFEKQESYQAWVKEVTKEDAEKVYKKLRNDLVNNIKNKSPYEYQLEMFKKDSSGLIAHYQFLKNKFPNMAKRVFDCIENQETYGLSSKKTVVEMLEGFLNTVKLKQKIGGVQQVNENVESCNSFLKLFKALLRSSWDEIDENGIKVKNEKYSKDLFTERTCADLELSINSVVTKARSLSDKIQDLKTEIMQLEKMGKTGFYKEAKKSKFWAYLKFQVLGTPAENYEGFKYLWDSFYYSYNEFIEMKVKSLSSLERELGGLFYKEGPKLQNEVEKLLHNIKGDEYNVACKGQGFGEKSDENKKLLSAKMIAFKNYCSGQIKNTWIFLGNKHHEYWPKIEPKVIKLLQFTAQCADEHALKVLGAALAWRHRAYAYALANNAAEGIHDMHILRRVSVVTKCFRSFLLRSVLGKNKYESKHLSDSIVVQRDEVAE